MACRLLEILLCLCTISCALAYPGIPESVPQGIMQVQHFAQGTQYQVLGPIVGQSPQPQPEAPAHSVVIYEHEPEPEHEPEHEPEAETQPRKFVLILNDVPEAGSGGQADFGHMPLPEEAKPEDGVYYKSITRENTVYKDDPEVEKRVTVQEEIVVNPNHAPREPAYRGQFYPAGQEPVETRHLAPPPPQGNIFPQGQGQNQGPLPPIPIQFQQQGLPLPQFQGQGQGQGGPGLFQPLQLLPQLPVMINRVQAGGR